MNETFDVIVLSHVLEHLEDPASFLQAVRKSMSFRYAILEVPLEDLLASRVKALFRDRRISKAGHVQFFTPGTFERLLEHNGFRIVDRSLEWQLPILWQAATCQFCLSRYGQDSITRTTPCCA